MEELEAALTHVLAEGAPPAPADLWVTVRTPEGDKRRCWRSGFVRLASPLAEEPVPLGVGWLFEDVTEAKQGEQEAALLRFRTNQLHRAARAAAECEDPVEAATVHLDFALAGYADHALVDRLAGGPRAEGEPGPVRLVRLAATPAGAPGPSLLTGAAGLPVRYREGHPALRCVERTGTVRADAGPVPAERAREWALERQWPGDAVHALCAVLRSRGRTLGVVTFLRGAGRSRFERSDAAYAEDVAVRIAMALDLAEAVRERPPGRSGGAGGVSGGRRSGRRTPPSPGCSTRGRRRRCRSAAAGFDAAVGEGGGGGRHDGLHQGGGDDRGGGGEGRRDGVEGEFGVADGDLRVEDDVAVVLEEGAGAVPGRRLRGVRDRGDADDPYAVGAGGEGHLHGQGVAPGQGDDR